MARRIDYVKGGGSDHKKKGEDVSTYLGAQQSFVPDSVVKKAQPAPSPKKRTLLRGVFIGVFTLLGILASGALAYGGYWYYSEWEPGPPTITLTNPETNQTTTLSYGEQALLSQPDFFKEVKQAFVSNETTFLEANLADMKIRFYNKGELVKEVDILTKGKEGSWWETPAGLYKVQMKAENHFSSFGHVYQPWSMAFQGNFFIHGWPYYPDGTPVDSAYSGGCIRLANEDAEALYTLAEVNTPVLVYEDDYSSDGFTYSIAAPDVTAEHYAVLDIESGTILAEKDMEKVRPIASITKLATALVAAEHINLDKDILIDESMLASTSIPRLVAGEAVSAYSLLLPLLLESSNEAAEAFASRVGRGRFIGLMNEKAAALGMDDTRFTDPAGSEHANVSSVADLLRLAQYLYNNRSFVLRISSGKDVPTAYRVTDFPNLQNFNEVPGVSGFAGGKVGKNSIGETALLLFTIDVGSEQRTVAVVVLDSQDRNADARALLRHIERTYGAQTNVI